MKAVLTIKKLRIQFNSRSESIQAVRDVSFSINSGEVVGLVGESGCGKSVTAQSILGLLEKNAQIVSGEILFENENLLTKSEKEMQKVRGKKIGMIFQDPAMALNPTLKIGFQIAECLQKHENLSKLEAHAKTIELLTQVGISNPKDRFYQYPHELSGGMRQRIIIAIALACQPQLLIADEPTTALDVTIQAQILELLKAIQTQRQISFLFISHDLGVIANICDRLLIMYQGEIIEEGSVQQVFSNPLHPYTKMLINSKRSLDES